MPDHYLRNYTDLQWNVNHVTWVTLQGPLEDLKECVLLSPGQAAPHLRPPQTCQQRVGDATRWEGPHAISSYKWKLEKPKSKLCLKGRLEQDWESEKTFKNRTDRISWGISCQSVEGYVWPLSVDAACPGLVTLAVSHVVCVCFTLDSSKSMTSYLSSFSVRFPKLASCGL